MEILGFDLFAIDLAAWWTAAWAFVQPRLAPSLGIVLIAVFVYYPVRWVVRRFEKRFAAQTDTKLDDHVARLVSRSLQISAVAWALWRLFDVWELPLAASATDALWIAALAFPLSSFIGEVLEMVEHRVVEKTEGTLDDTALPLLNKVIRFLVIVLGVVIGLDHMGLNIAPLLAGAGVMGLALSLAAKDTLSNLIAGVLLILDRPFQIGDRIELWSSPAETGSWGDVIEIGLRATKIRNPDNLVVVVPNNEIMRRDIVNYTMSGSRIRLRIPIDVEYESDLRLAKELILEAVSAVEGVAHHPTPVVILRGFGPSEVKLELRVWIEDARRRRAIGDEITGLVVQRFADAGVAMPYPKREIYVHNADAARGAGLLGAGGDPASASSNRGADAGRS
ncbi:MAG: mechanosensitive ion channel [Gemmatimonadota bacterium]|nr:mechanosensitive ion channel [Gemmatimonadota bacterium]